MAGKQRLLHITARHEKTGKVVDLFYVSIKQAAHYNPGFSDFREVEYEDVKDENAFFDRTNTRAKLFQQKTRDDIADGKQETLAKWTPSP